MVYLYTLIVPSNLDNSPGQPCRGPRFGRDFMVNQLPAEKSWSTVPRGPDWCKMPSSILGRI
jgi:hypothetical protein